MMKEQILKRSVSYVLTLCMLFLMLPVISLDVTAVGDEDILLAAYTGICN